MLFLVSGLGPKHSGEAAAMWPRKWRGQRLTAHASLQHSLQILTTAIPHMTPMQHSYYIRMSTWRGGGAGARGRVGDCGWWPLLLQSAFRLKGSGSERLGFCNLEGLERIIYDHSNDRKIFRTTRLHQPMIWVILNVFQGPSQKPESHRAFLGLAESEDGHFAQPGWQLRAFTWGLETRGLGRPTLMEVFKFWLGQTLQERVAGQV